MRLESPGPRCLSPGPREVCQQMSLWECMCGGRLGVRGCCSARVEPSSRQVIVLVCPHTANAGVPPDILGGPRFTSHILCLCQRSFHSPSDVPSALPVAQVIKVLKAFKGETLGSAYSKLKIGAEWGFPPPPPYTEHSSRQQDCSGNPVPM